MTGLRRLVLLAGLGFASAVVTACSGNTCHPGDCEPCVAESCETICVDPDDEDVGYTCLWECLDDATCDLACEGVGCNLACAASSCSCRDCDARCTDGAACAVDGLGARVGCDASTCDVTCEAVDDPRPCIEACTNGSTCSMQCGGQAGDFTPQYVNRPVCAVSCDASSSCHLACEGFARCSVCCGGSVDCTIDCPAGGATCEDGNLVCGGTTCEEAASTCPVYADDWLDS